MKKLFFAFLFASLVALPAVAQQQQGQTPVAPPEQQQTEQAKAGQQADKTSAAQPQQKKASQQKKNGQKQAGDTKTVSLGKQKYNVTISGPIKGLRQAEAATLKDEKGNLLMVSRLGGSYGATRWNNAINGVSPEKGYALYKDQSGTPINHKIGQNGWITVFKDQKNNRIVARYDRNPRTGEVTMLKKNVPNGASLSQAYEELKGASPKQFDSVLNGARSSAGTCSYGKCDGPDFIPQ